MLPAYRRILDKLDGVKFLFIVQVIEKAQKKAYFSFVVKRSLYYKNEIVLRGIQHFLYGGERLACFEM